MEQENAENPQSGTTAISFDKDRERAGCCENCYVCGNAVRYSNGIVWMKELVANQNEEVIGRNLRGLMD